MNKFQHITIQGHRGFRGLYPENTLTAFIEAVKLGVTHLELDVVISKDHKVVVSHEPWMNHLFCTTPTGEKITKENELKYNLYTMNYTEIALFECGLRGNENFVNQHKVKSHKPLLSEVIEAVNAFTLEHKIKPIIFNIEIKTEINGDDVFHPKPKPFVKLVYKILQQYNVLQQTILQSFDVRILEEIKLIDKKIPISYLVENKNSLKYNLKLLSFKPDIYAPEFILIDEQVIADLKTKNIPLTTWTVNETSDMQRLVNMGVNNFITDYPDKAIEFFSTKFK